MKPAPQVIFLHYWGSYFKNRRQVDIMAAMFRPMLARGWRCHLVLDRPPADPDWEILFRDLGVEIHFKQRPCGNFDWRAVRRVYELCRCLRATVFRCDNMHTSPLIGSFLAGVPARVWYKHAMNTDFEECRSPTFRERCAVSTRLSCRLASRVLVVSQAVKDELVQLGIPGQRIGIRHNPRSLGTVNGAWDRESTRRSLGYSPSDIVVVNVGRAEPVKGWDILLRAFAPVAEADPRARLLLIGSIDSTIEKPFHARLVSFIEERKLSRRVVFAGHIGDLRPVLHAADLFVMPSRSEGFCMALIEALEAGLPCVATRVGIAPEVIQEGVNGLLVDRGDVEAMAKALLRLVQDHALRTRFGAAAVVPPFIPTLGECAEQFAREYELLLSSAGHALRASACSMSPIL